MVNKDLHISYLALVFFLRASSSRLLDWFPILHTHRFLFFVYLSLRVHYRPATAAEVVFWSSLFVTLFVTVIVDNITENRVTTITVANKLNKQAMLCDHPNEFARW